MLTGDESRLKKTDQVAHNLGLLFNNLLTTMAKQIARLMATKNICHDDEVITNTWDTA